MDFKKLQKMQLALDTDILSQKPKMSAKERFNKTLVALSVELAEVANTVEHFKFWKDNKGKVDEKRFSADWSYGGKQIIGYYDNDPKGNLVGLVTFEQAHHLTLVEEAADCLHFILSLANQIEYEIDSNLIKLAKYQIHPLETLYMALQNKTMDLETGYDKMGSYKSLLSFYTSYIIELGITTEELEQAYYAKNEVNYQRLEEGY